MSKVWLRICSLVLVIVMTVNMLPLNVFAEQSQSINSTSISTNASNKENSDASIVEEYTDNRTEFSKEFLLDNGLSLAVVYNSAVHYMKNGQWEEIDNTLQTNTSGKFTNKAGIWDVAFPQQISSNNQISITKDGYTLSFGMAGELRQQGNLEVMSAGEKTTTASSSSNSQTEHTSEAPSIAEAEPVTNESELTAAVSESTEPETTEPETTEPETTEPETTEPETTEPETTEPETTEPETTESETTEPETTEPETTEPETTEPETTEPETTEPKASISNNSSLGATTQTVSVTVDGTAQTFAVNSAKTVQGRIQTFDNKAILEEVEHEETILQKPVSQLRYSDVYTDTDIQYDLIGNQLKESIIMDSYSSTLRGYRYTLNTGEMIPVLNDDGSIYLYDKDKKNIVMVMPAPYLEDNALVYNYDINVTLTGNNGNYTLCYLLPTAWLAEEERAWPVILDPVISAYIDINNIQDKSVGSWRDYSYNAGINECGVCTTKNGLQRFFVMYNSLPALTSSDVIIDASIRLYKPHNSDATHSVEVHKVNSTWSSTTMTWANQPTHNPIAEDYMLVAGAGYYTWNITDIVRGWYSGQNTGMVFRVDSTAEAQLGTKSWKQFYSSDYGSAAYMPNMWIYFRNNNGLEEYWDYTATSAGRAGTGYISHYTGNLVWEHNDMGFGGNRMPVSISHIYNANDSTNNRFGIGTGWRTNFNQRVYLWSANNYYYVWEDSDGTAHYFLYESSGVYKDEDGLELTLTTTGSGTGVYCITDKNGNKSYFDTHGRLTKLENNQATKSSISIAYTTDSGLLISQITDGAGRIYKFTYSNNLLSRIGYYGTGATELYYTTYTYSGSNLTGIGYKDGKQVIYGYTSNNLLSSVQDIDGYRLEYSYNTVTAGQPNRVNQLREYDGSTEGGKVDIEYAHNQTTFTDHAGNVQVHQFNNLGNTVAVQDNEGHAQYAKYSKNNSGDSGKSNRLMESSKLQNTVSNLLRDSSFENGTLWSTGITSGTVSIANEGYLGSKSLSNEAGDGMTCLSEPITLAAGESCTFSAYVKTIMGTSGIAFYDVSTQEQVSIQQLTGSNGWTRLEANYTNTSGSNKTLCAAFFGKTGASALMDCVQLEKSPTASRYNLIQNGDFRTGGSPAQYWTSSGFASSDSVITANDQAAPQLDAKVLQISGSPNAAKKATQTIPVSGSSGDSYIVSGWAKGDSVPLTGSRQFGIRLIFNNTDGTTTPVVAQFNPDTNSTANWQYSAAAAVAKSNYSSITVEVVYEYNANTAQFDGIQLYKEEFSNSYTYDNDGNVISVVDLQQQETKYEYTNNNLTKQILPSGATLTYTYDNYHNVLTATTDVGVVYNFAYDTYGNNTEVSIVSGGNKITAKAAYSSDGNRLVSATDATGKVTSYSYNANTNVLEWVKYPEDTAATRTNYTYDTMYRMASAAATTDSNLALSAAYTYSDDLLASIQTGSTKYDFSYGNFALRDDIKIGTRTLAEYSYTAKDHYLSALDYGNGDKVQYEYDKQGRVTKQTYEDGATVTYRYDNNGALAAITDSKTGITSTYYYDFIDRMMKYVEEGNDFSHSVGYAYDTLNNLTSLVETINGTKRTTSYSYDDDNRVTKVTAGNAQKTYSYDGFGRVNQQQVKNGNSVLKTDNFTFTAPSSSATSSQIAGHTVVAGAFNKTYSYTYDDNGNITSINDGSHTVSYVYDSANQLVRENNQIAQTTTTWTYDNAGNILERKEYAYTTGTLGDALDTITYTYGDSQWGDLLTAYDGQTITHDGIGNPLTDGTWTYTWQHGRQLASMAKSSTTWNFTYNSDGLRTKRTNGTKTYSYVYNGDKLSQMTVGSDVLNFTYDAAGTPLTLDHNGTLYYYVTNIQGDVIGILDNSQTMVVQYHYDAWGNLLSTTGTKSTTLGVLNPLRYRGYVFDQEYGFYYLQSRYYDSELGRFINSDVFASTGQGILGNNMYSYCGGNPVIRRDNSGEYYALCKADMVSAYGGGRIPSSYAYAGLAAAAGVIVANAWDDIKETVSKSIAKIKTAKKYRSPTESHHIAAKQSRKAAEARAILEEIFPDGVENPLNKVDLKTSVHRRVHTNLYYATVNSLVVYAYDSAGEDKEKAATNVINTINIIRANLLVLNETTE